MLFSPSPAPPLCPVSCPPGGLCLCLCLCLCWGATSHPHCLLVCLCVLSRAGWSFSSGLEQRLAGCVQGPRASPDPAHEPHLDTRVGSKCSERSPSPSTGAHRPGRRGQGTEGAHGQRTETEASELQMSRGTRPCKISLWARGSRTLEGGPGGLQWPPAPPEQARGSSRMRAPSSWPAWSAVLPRFRLLRPALEQQDRRF